MNSPLQLLNKLSQLLKVEKINYAVSGGIAASFYRHEPRLTKDIDIAILFDDLKKAEAAGSDILCRFDFNVGKVQEFHLTRTPQMNKKRSPIHILVGRKKDDDSGLGIDILLPSMPWVKDAVQRAQHNIIDYGFDQLPTLTVEDIIIAKAFSLKDKTRYKDMDDLQSIFKHAEKNQIDIVYTTSQLEKFNLTLPKELEKQAPEGVRKILKKIRIQNNQ